MLSVSDVPIAVSRFQQFRRVARNFVYFFSLQDNDKSHVIKIFFFNIFYFSPDKL